jgi:glycosyltransferase involved in cell wall biosynthesis
MKIGSCEAQIFTVARLLEEAGLAVTISFAGAISDAVRAYFSVNGNSLVCELGSLTRDDGRANWLGHLRAERPDLLWLHFFPPTGPFIAQLRRACPKAAIYFCDHVSRGYDQRSLPKAIFCRLRAALFARRIDCYIGVSRFVSQRLEKNDFIPADRIRTVYNGIDLARFHPADHAGSNIVAICKMTPAKGVPVLLEALLLLKQRGLELPCRIVGTGPCLLEFQAFAREQNLTNVEFLGSRDDVPDVLRAAQVTVVPSVWEEAFGLAAAESLAVGVPVIASRIGALPELIDEGTNGLLVAPGDPRALADALCELTSDPERLRSMSKAARAKAEREFDLNKLSRNLVEILLQREPIGHRKTTRPDE